MRSFKILLISFFILCSLIAWSQKTNFIIVKEKKNNEDIMQGYCNRADLMNFTFKQYFDLFYKSYEPNLGKVDSLKQLIMQKKSKYNHKKINIKIVMATWCSDSQEQVPRFFKIVDLLGFNEKNIQIICVDRNKQTPDRTIGVINKVPTFIFYYKKQEKGKIVEIPVVSIESDWLNIFKL